MAAVLGIVRGHDGAIRIESQEGAGTEVRVLLPLRESGPELVVAGNAARCWSWTTTRAY